jgi:hypothetical protein
MKQKSPAPGATAPAPQAVSPETLNPLIDLEFKDTANVAAALKFLANVFFSVEPGEGLHLNNAESWGLSLLLQTCVAALETTNGKGGEA